MNKLFLITHKKVVAHKSTTFLFLSLREITIIIKTMTVKQHNVQRLSNAQLLLLNMFEHDLSETDLESLRRNLVKFLNSKLQNELNSVIKTKKMTSKDINFNEMGDNRTEYLTKIRTKQ